VKLQAQIHTTGRGSEQLFCSAQGKPRTTQLTAGGSLTKCQGGKRDVLPGAARRGWAGAQAVPGRDPHRAPAISPSGWNAIFKLRSRRNCTSFPREQEDLQEQAQPCSTSNGFGSLGEPSGSNKLHSK